jgi:predicted metal-binding membrane protein
MITCTTSLGSDLGHRICGLDAGTSFERRCGWIFAGVSASLFVASAACTVDWCSSMSAMPGMPMPGGWTMSMMWMRAPGQTWIETGASFFGMWITMMAAMMLPSEAPMLWRYCQAIRRRGESRPRRLTLIAALGYFFVWALLGVAVFPLGTVLATIEMKQPGVARAVPVAAATVILIAGAFQLTPWKMHHLALCRDATAGGILQADARAAWRQGLRFGVHCTLSCANLTAILLVVGLMDLSAMALITCAITAERLVTAGVHVTRLTGVVAIAWGMLLLVQAFGR